MTKRIITVEDSTSLREMISFTLSEAGYEVAQAEDGQDALDKLTEFKADLVITDLNMPKMNGIELTSSLRANQMYRFIPIIFLTTESQLQKKQAAKEAGATGWIVKPFKPDQLLQVVRKVLG
ncbi:MAG TPA: two-component system response regulator [Desulfobulbaceae bacterium]|nr:two-component system response regulator [Desulfobulbaceae bacterium]